MLASLSHDAQARPDVAARLEAITQALRGHPANGAEPDPGFETATDDEMFVLVEKELESFDHDQAGDFRTKRTGGA